MVGILSALPSLEPDGLNLYIEHHSNMLPWRELGFDVETVNLRNGNVDLHHLEQILIQEANRSVKIGSFSAVSNLTGIIADDLAITALLHKHGALSVWDYATGASYMNMSMNPTHPEYPDPSLIAKDAIVFSGHKILGGVGTPVSLLFAPILRTQGLHPRRCRDRKVSLASLHKSPCKRN